MATSCGIDVAHRGGDGGEHHADDAVEVAASGGGLGGESAQAEDEQHTCDQVCDGDERFRHDR